MLFQKLCECHIECDLGGVPFSEFLQHLEVLLGIFPWCSFLQYNLRWGIIHDDKMNQVPTTIKLI